MEKPATTTLWITWYPHRRTSGLCDRWRIPLEVVGARHEGVRKWLHQSLHTLRLLRHRRPDILFVQNPSLGLTILAKLVRPWGRYYLVVDAHNEGVRPYNRTGKWITWLTRRLLSSADVTLVTNDALARDVTAAGGRPLVLPDRLPTPPEFDTDPTAAKPATGEVAVIATFAPDEPVRELLEAASSLPDVRFAITGKPANFERLRLQLPPNVRLTGFLEDAEYWQLLARAQVVCDLTLMPDCLVCGAYEALALGQPMVLSDNPPTRTLFGGAALFARPDAGNIATAIRDALGQQVLLRTGAQRTREAYRISWEEAASSVWEEIVKSERRSAPKGTGAHSL
jgi:glycosyltransferase involved in cell wall biosynthesis